VTSVLVLGLNDIGERIYNWLVEQEDANVLAMVTEKSQLSIVDQLQPDLLISVGFRHIVPDEVLNVPSLGAVNFHKSYLPYNRGANPNVWSIVEDNPAGVSLHYMTADVDAGPLIDRRMVPVKPEDDARDLYERLEDAQFEQFVEVWPDMRRGTVDATEQPGDEGTYHYKREFVDLWEIDRDEVVRVGDFINRLRALTFPPYDNAYFVEDGRKFHVELRITPADSEADGSRNDAKSKNVPTYSENGPS
jgi:methionyl-tRNA formyltransferase